MKARLFKLMCVALALAISLPSAVWAVVSTATASPASASVLVDGKKVSFEAYNINDNNYFNLRDIAYALNGTAKQFDVSWDSASNAVNLLKGKPYSATGGEMAGKGTGNKAAAPTSSKILVDGKEAGLTAYNIGGSNYFKLRDIGKAVDFSVTWDAASNTIAIDTYKGYVEDAPVKTDEGFVPGNFIVQKGDWLYYQNVYDERKLFKMRQDGTQKTKMTDHGASICFISGDWIYYQNWTDGAYYKIRTDGTGTKKLSKENEWLWLFYSDGEWLYVKEIRTDNILRIREDGTGKTKLNDVKTIEAAVSDGWIYYTYRNSQEGERKLCRVKTDGTENTEFDIAVSSSADLSIIGDWIYYTYAPLNQKGGAYKVRTDGTGKTTVINEDCGFLIVDGDRFYYDVLSMNPDGAIYKINADGTGKTKIAAQRSQKVAMVGDWLYILDHKWFNIYKVKKDGTGFQEIQ